MMSSSSSPSSALLVLLLLVVLSCTHSVLGGGPLPLPLPLALPPPSSSSSTCDYSPSSVLPSPFYRRLQVQDPPLHGVDVQLLRQLIARAASTPQTFNATASDQYDDRTADAVEKLQSAANLVNSGNFDCPTATALLACCSTDGYKDDGTIPPGYLYKVHIPVFRNRSIETVATLYDSNMHVLLRFTARTHGQNDAQGNALNEFSGDGSTPTGLMTFDLNSPEPDPVSYGPYPINRAVQGLKGNAAFLISNIRNGILMHTGEWANWNPSQPMPNSHGCVHAHPDDIKQVWQILTNDLGVVVHDNTYGKLPYPYKPQGILSIEQVD